MQYKLFIQATPGERCKIQGVNPGERQYNRAKVGSDGREKDNKLVRGKDEERCKYNEAVVRRKKENSGERCKI